MITKPLFGAFAAAALLAACASQPPPPPRPMAQPAPVAIPAPEPAAPTGDGRVASITFDGTGSELNEMGRTNLTPVVDRLMANPRSRVMITTYADRAGAPMARTRAAAVRQALLDRGVPANRIRVMQGRAGGGMDAGAVQVNVR